MFASAPSDPSRQNLPCGKIGRAAPGAKELIRHAAPLCPRVAPGLQRWHEEHPLPEDGIWWANSEKGWNA